MAVWVDTAGSGSGLSPAYVADMGVYTGPWPPHYPEVFDGFEPTWGDALDFYLALENPAHPGDPLFLVDGSYPAQVWDIYRYDVGPLDTGWVWFGTGGADTPVYGQEPPAGAHLWVVGTHFSSSTSGVRIEPVYPPEHYVPASLGGTAPESPWGYSAWQPGLTVDTTVPVSSGSNWNDTLGADHTRTATSPVNPPPVLDFGATLAPALASATVTRGGITIGAVLSVSGEKTGKILSGSAFSQSYLDVSQFSYDFQPDYTPPPFDPPGVAGVDWGYPPFQPSPVSYELPGPADWTWGEWAFQAGGVLGSSTGNAPGRLSEVLVIGWTADSIPEGAPAYPPAGFHSMGEVPVASDDPVDSGTGFGPDHAYTLYVDESTPPPTVTLLVWSMSAATQSWNSGAGSDFAWPPNGQFSWSVNFKPTPSTDVDLPLQWTTHRWRYWTTPELAWHTVGGHWSSSQTMQILTPGVGWVPIVDGPA
jgi:hypothetical protein